MNEKSAIKVDELHGKDLAEAAQTYAFSALDVDLPDDVQRLWEASFEDEDERREAEAALAGLDDSDRELLLVVALQGTANDSPARRQLLHDSVEQAGQSMFVIELAAVTIAGALLLREHHKKGRAKEKKRKIVIEPERITIEESETTYETSSALSTALAKLGLGSGA